MKKELLPSFSGAVEGKTVKTSVLPGFSKIERASGAAVLLN
jgi:hypothetical protein